MFWNMRGLERVVNDSVDAAMASAPPAMERNEQHGYVDERVDQLLLVCAAMWDLIREKTNLTEEDLINRMAVLDAKDGVADGKLTLAPRLCPKCNRTNSPKHERCLYCGCQMPVDSVFKTI